MPLLPGYAGSWSRLSLRPVHRAGQPTAGWWRDALIHQIYPRSFTSDQHSAAGFLLPDDTAVGRLEGTGR